MPSSVSRYQVGQKVRLRTWFTDPENADSRVAVTASIKVQDPAGVDTTYSPTYDSADVSYYYDLVVSAAGTYYYRGEAASPYQAAAERSFIVETSQF